MDIEGRVKELNNKILITLQTRGRLDRKLQNTINLIPPYIREHVLVFTSPDEVDPLKKVLPDVKSIIGVPHDSIGELRYKVLKASPMNTLIMDDSLNFHTREPSQIGKETAHPLKGIVGKHFTEEKRGELVLEMFEWVANKLDSNDYGMVGLSNRPTNWQLEGEEVINHRIWGIWGVNIDMFNNMKDVKMSGRHVKEDMYLQLKFITNGIPTTSSVRFAFDRRGGINSPGGVSRYRNLEILHKQADYMVEQFPQYVSKIMKSAKSMNGFEGEVPDIRVKWSKAYTDNV